MLIMGLDSALQRCSVAILKDGASLSARSAEMERGHAEHIAPMAAAALEEAGVAAGDLDRIGVVVGPGGFTGVRIALSFARAFGLATETDVVGVTSLAALAYGVGAKGGLVAPIVDARRGQVYAGLYRDGDALVAPFVASPEAAIAALTEAASGAPAMIVGTGADLVKAPPAWGIDPSRSQIDPIAVARLAAAAPAPTGPPAPLYLRAPDAKPPAARR